MMTKLVRILSERGNSAYDALRNGLVVINASDFLIALLPDFSNDSNLARAMGETPDPNLAVSNTP